MRDARGGQRQRQLMLSTSGLGLSSPAVALSIQFYRAPSTRPAAGGVSVIGRASCSAPVAHVNNVNTTAGEA